MSRQRRQGRVRDIRGNPVLLLYDLYVRKALLLRFKRCEGVWLVSLLLWYEYFEHLPRQRVVLSPLQESIRALCPTQMESEYANWTTEDVRYTARRASRTIHMVQVGDRTTDPNQNNHYIQKPRITPPIKTQPSISKIWIAFVQPPKFFRTGYRIPQQSVAHRPPSHKFVQ